MAKPRILVIGSSNMDIFLNVQRIPFSGQTVIERKNSYEYLPGGKGANAALAMALLGCETVFCTRVGSDSHGSQLKRVFNQCDLDTRFVFMDKSHPTGLAAVTVEQSGENRIVVYPGANDYLSINNIEEAFACYPDAVYFPFEISWEIAVAATNFAKKQNIPVFIDAAPSNPSHNLSLLQNVEIFSPNESETQMYTGIYPDTVENCLRACIALKSLVKAKYYVLKRGERGSFFYDGTYHNTDAAACDVRAIDTTGAGDAFTAALTYEYMRSNDIRRACRFANIIGAYTVTKKGAAPSLPSYEDAKEFADKYNILFDF